MEQVKGGVTAAKGFLAASVAAEIKYKDREDMAMIYSRFPCKAAGTFTTNVVKAAPVIWDKEIVTNSEYAQAVVINSGIANACTGEKGYSYCSQTAKKAADVLQIPKHAVLVASTGVIGMNLPMERIVNGIEMMAPKLQDSRKAGYLAARAIMTKKKRQ